MVVTMVGVGVHVWGPCLSPWSHIVFLIPDTFCDELEMDGTRPPFRSQLISGVRDVARNITPGFMSVFNETREVK